MNRRGALRLLGLGSIAGPIAAKGAAEKAAMDLAGILPPIYGNGAAVPQGGTVGSSRLPLVQRALLNTIFRQQLEQLMYEDERTVGRLDPDLAAMRSFSLAAKITYQRRRNVARRMDYFQGGSSWQRVDALLDQVNKF